MILSPFSWERFTLDCVFIIDLFLTGIFLAFLLVMQVWKGKSLMLARVAVVSATLYILLCAGNHLWALSLAKNYASRHGLKTENIASLPEPLSPFHWANYIVTPDTVYRGLVNLIGEHQHTADSRSGLLSKILAQYQPIGELSYEPWRRFDRSPWVDRALDLKGVRTFFWFARFPVVRHKKIADGRERVTFFDLRFGTVQGRKPFSYEAIFDANGEIVFQGFRKDLSPLDDQQFRN